MPIKFLALIRGSADLQCALCSMLHSLRLSAVVAYNVVGFLLVAFASELWVALAGVAAMSLGQGLGEASLLSYTAFFKDK